MDNIIIIMIIVQKYIIEREKNWKRNMNNEFRFTFIIIGIIFLEKEIFLANKK